MTYEEALDWCEQFTDNLVAYNGDTKRRTLGLQAMQTIKKALEKQIPKKPIGRHTSYKCPVCGRRVRSGKGSSSRGVDYFCQRCGQALDWSDTE